MERVVDILLATYQGEAYIEELLESLFSQSYPFFHLLIRDDGSKDGTLCIIKKWCTNYPEKITLIPSSGTLGIKGNFSELMAQSTASYVMFADQDDKWLPAKIELSMNQMRTMERQYGTHVPLLVHTDLKVADQQLNVLSPSFWNYTGLNPLHVEATKLNKLLPQNIFTGCTLLLNRTLSRLAYPIPEESIMHDWWIGLVAACFGHISALNQPTILYRQHGKNDTGAKRYSIVSQLKRLINANPPSVNLGKTCKQAMCFLQRYENGLQNQQNNLTLLKAYGELESLPFFKQKRHLIKHRFFKHGFLRNIRELFSPHVPPA